MFQLYTLFRRMYLILYVSVVYIIWAYVLDSLCLYTLFGRMYLILYVSVVYIIWAYVLDSLCFSCIHYLGVCT